MPEQGKAGVADCGLHGLRLWPLRTFVNGGAVKTRMPGVREAIVLGRKLLQLLVVSGMEVDGVECRHIVFEDQDREESERCSVDDEFHRSSFRW